MTITLDYSFFSFFSLISIVYILRNLLYPWTNWKHKLSEIKTFFWYIDLTKYKIRKISQSVIHLIGSSAIGTMIWLLCVSSFNDPIGISIGLFLGGTITGVAQSFNDDEFGLIPWAIASMITFGLLSALIWLNDGIMLGGGFIFMTIGIGTGVVAGIVLAIISYWLQRTRSDFATPPIFPIKPNALNASLQQNLLNPVVPDPEKLSTAQDLHKHLGTWVGDDLDECLEIVYNTRSEATF